MVDQLYRPRTVTFSIAPERVAEVLRNVASIPGVLRTAQVSPDSKSRLGQSMCFAEIDDKANPDSVLEVISRQQGVEGAGVPPMRRAL